MELAAISYDSVPTLADFATRRGISFPLLSDAGSDTIKRYGILNTTIDPKNELYGYPDRKSTRLNSSHPSISYAVFCLKKKKTTEIKFTIKMTQFTLLK